jgi:two-component system cell cycle sensor histidine kinase/response regulator CckA
MQRRTKRDAEERACRARQMEVVGHLAGGFAHDFANVITVVQGYASMLEETLEPSDARSQDVAAIRRAAERGAALARQLRALSGASAAAPELLAIDTLVMDMLPVMRRLVGDGIAIVTYATASPRVLVDARRLEQVLLNLALHARDTMPGGGRLTIETRRVDVDESRGAAGVVRRAGDHRHRRWRQRDRAAGGARSRYARRRSRR